jgi:hypothetical protein
LLGGNAPRIGLSERGIVFHDRLPFRATPDIAIGFEKAFAHRTVIVIPAFPFARGNCGDKQQEPRQ